MTTMPRRREPAAPPTGDPVGDPTGDVVNTVALTRCTDTRHRIHVFGAAGVRSLPLAELDRRATAVAYRLHALGLRPGDRVGVMARNRVEWVLLDLAILKVGGVTAGFEPGRFDPARLVADYGLALLFTEDAGEAGATDGAGDSGDGSDARAVVPAGAVLDIGTVAAWAEEPAPDEPLHGGYDPADICAIKFTSGSTGVPKGLEVTAASVNDSLVAVQEMFAHGPDDNILVFLRLALLQQRYWIYSALVNRHDVTVANIADALPAARATAPTVVMGVPGFYEDLKARLQAAGPVADLAARRAAIQAELGGRVRYLWTGSAPASRAVLEFFNHGGVPLYEGYGQNETCIVAKNHPGAFRLGSVGRVLPNKRVRFDRDGILIVASRNPVNCRYTWCAPGTNEQTFLPTAEVKTYDIGHVDEDGYLYIHGRVDDVLTLSSGRNVLARLVEEKLREHTAVHECVLFGTGKDFLSAIISPAGPDPDHDALGAFVADVNAGLLAEQRVLALLLATEPFSIDNGLLSSQFKPRRSEIHRRYADDLALIYDGAGDGPPTGDRVVVVTAAGVAGEHRKPTVKQTTQQERSR